MTHSSESRRFSASFLLLSAICTFSRLWGSAHAQFPVNFSCPQLPPLTKPAQNVYQLKPQDIKVVMALGDSITAGNGQLRTVQLLTMLLYRLEVCAGWRYARNIYMLRAYLQPAQTSNLYSRFSYCSRVLISVVYLATIAGMSALHHRLCCCVWLLSRIMEMKRAAVTPH